MHVSVWLNKGAGYAESNRPEWHTSTIHFHHKNSSSHNIDSITDDACTRAPPLDTKNENKHGGVPAQNEDEEF